MRASRELASRANETIRLHLSTFQGPVIDTLQIQPGRRHMTVSVLLTMAEQESLPALSSRPLTCEYNAETGESGKDFLIRLKAELDEWMLQFFPPKQDKRISAEELVALLTEELEPDMGPDFEVELSEELDGTIAVSVIGFFVFEFNDETLGVSQQEYQTAGMADESFSDSRDVLVPCYRELMDGEPCLSFAHKAIERCRLEYAAFLEQMGNEDTELMGNWWDV